MFANRNWYFANSMRTFRLSYLLAPKLEKKIHEATRELSMTSGSNSNLFKKYFCDSNDCLMFDSSNSRSSIRDRLFLLLLPKTRKLTRIASIWRISVLECLVHATGSERLHNLIRGHRSRNYFTFKLSKNVFLPSNFGGSDRITFCNCSTWKSSCKMLFECLEFASISRCEADFC